MQFCLQNTPAKFQRAIDIILSEVYWKTSLFYTDDNAIFSKSNCQYFKDIDKVLTLLRQAGLTPKLPKSHVLQNGINILAMYAKSTRLAAASKNVDAIKSAVYP